MNVNLSQAQIEKADFLGTMFDCRTTWPKGFDPIVAGASPMEEKCGDKFFASHNFSGKKFKRFERLGPVNFKGANFKNAEMYGVSLIGANIEGGDFTDADIGGVDLRNSNLEKAKLTGIKIQGTNFDGANLKNADFSGAYLENARFQNTNVSGADFTGVTFVSTNFTGATYDDDTIWPDGFNISDHGLVKAK